MNEINLVLLILIIGLFFSIFYSFFQKENFAIPIKENFAIPIKENFAIPTNHERPYVNVYDEKRNQLPIVLLSHPFTRDNSYKQHQQYKKDGFLILGISSYNEFPSITTNKHDVLNNSKEKAWTNYDYMKETDGWLHCFRDPKKHIAKSMPKTLLSESDFCNYDVYKPNPEIKKIYDFIYICPKDAGDSCDGWVSTNKNWDLAQKCIEVMCSKYKFKGLLVGRKGCKLSKSAEKLCHTTGFLSQLKLIEAYNQSKFILIPNQSDASPRILTEALCVNVPALVNYNIVGGWKYINSQTGAFFSSMDDFDQGLNFIVRNYNRLQPRNNFITNFSYKVSGKKLKKFIEKHFRHKVDVSHCKYLTL